MRYLRLFFILLTMIFVMVVYQQQRNQVLVLPSHPFVDQNNNGIDDFEEGTGQYADPEVRAKIYGVDFPIGELGNCSDYNSCHSYCEDPVNATACIDFAKARGFYQDEQSQMEEKFLKAAKDQLGCDSVQSCMTFCDNPDNFSKCDEFAKNLALSGGYTDDPRDREVLNRAKDALGCDSYGSCVDFCSQDANRQKCNDFAQQTGLRGGVQIRGPGGCSSEDNCQSYCADPGNFSQCSQYASQYQQGNFRGPGGCDNPESCRAYCEENPDSCRSYIPGSSGHYVPVSCPPGMYFGPGGVCTPEEKSQEANSCMVENKYWNGQSCQDRPPPGVYNSANTYFAPREDMGGCKTPGECYDWCSANPGQCSGFNPDYPRPNDYIPTINYTPGTEIKFEPKPDMGGCTTPGECYDWCSANPGKCSGFDSTYTRPPDTYQGTYPNVGSSPAPGGYSQPGSGQTSYPSNLNVGGCTTPGSCYDWCSANPGQCSGFNPNSPRPSDTYQPYSGSGTYYPPYFGSGSYQPYSGSESYSQPYSGSGSYTPPSDSGSYSQPAQSGAPAPTETQSQPSQPSGDSGSTQSQPAPSEPAPQPMVQGARFNPLDIVVSFFKSLASLFIK